MNEWIRTKNKLPTHSGEVEVIFLINDIDIETPGMFKQRRLIGIGRFDHSYGWFIRNGYIIAYHYLKPTKSDPYKKWELVTHWKELDKESAEILSKRGWDKEDFT